MKPKSDLEKRRVLVTGGASGIGLATAGAGLNEGATVAINNLPGDRLDAVVNELAADGLRRCRRLETLATPGRHAMVGDAITRPGGLDYLINDAGTPAAGTPISRGDFDCQDERLWHRLLNVNLLGHYRRSRVTALRQANGAIVSIASFSVFGRGG